jgi:hypothetical protein
MQFLTTIIAASVALSGSAFAQTYIGTVQFGNVDGGTVKSNMQVGADYRQLTQPGEQAVMNQISGTSDNLICSSQTNAGVTTTVTGLEVRPVTSDQDRRSTC